VSGHDWLYEFIKRHSKLNLRKPPPTNLESTASCRNILSKFTQPQYICNMDESGVTTIQTPDRVLSMCGVKQVCEVALAERGQLIALAVYATGSIISPFLYPLLVE